MNYQLKKIQLKIISNEEGVLRVFHIHKGYRRLEKQGVTGNNLLNRFVSMAQRMMVKGQTSQKKVLESHGCSRTERT